MRLLIIRTSAMGDVALTVPVLRGMRQKYPDVELIFVSRPAFSAFFKSINGLTLFPADFNKRHKGIAGLITLFKDLRNTGRIDYVIDLHDVLRTKFLRFLFLIWGVPVKVVDKGRREKKLLIKGIKKEFLRHTVERYTEVFAKAGFDVSVPEGPWIIPGITPDSVTQVTLIDRNLNIGVAPFAKHELKMWPQQNMITLLEMISEGRDAKFWLFGGTEDTRELDYLSKRVPGSVNLSGKLTLEEELSVMTKLDFMIAMDSANMHMAALAGTRVISIWGATDPMTGFGALGQPVESFVRIPVEELTCRPCTIYGKGECWRGDHACMEWLTPKMVIDKIKEAGLIIKTHPTVY
jgi:ADP-heptose:LPS heptosyltransferase